MALRDHFIPDPPIQCPKCGGQFGEWDGRPEGCAFFVWKQNQPAPIDQRIDEDVRSNLNTLSQLRLPDKFKFDGASCLTCNYSLPISKYCCEGFCENGIWKRSEISPEPISLMKIEKSWVQCSKCFDAWEFKENQFLYICPNCDEIGRLESDNQENIAH